MRGAVPVLFTAHLLKLTVTRQVRALNPALRIPPTVSPNDKDISQNQSGRNNEYLYIIIEELSMLTKEKVKKTIDRLPDRFTVDQVVEELVVLDKIEKGLKEVEEGKVYSTQQVKDQLKKWL